MVKQGSISQNLCADVPSVAIAAMPSLWSFPHVRPCNSEPISLLFSTSLQQDELPFPRLEHILFSMKDMLFRMQIDKQGSLYSRLQDAISAAGRRALFGVLLPLFSYLAGCSFWL